MLVCVNFMICFNRPLHTLWTMGPTYNQYTLVFWTYVIEFIAMLLILICKKAYDKKLYFYDIADYFYNSIIIYL